VVTTIVIAQTTMAPPSSAIPNRVPLIDTLKLHDGIVDQDLRRVQGRHQQANAIVAFLQSALTIERKVDRRIRGPDHDRGGNPVNGLGLHDRQSQTDHRLVTAGAGLLRTHLQRVVPDGNARRLHCGADTILDVQRDVSVADRRRSTIRKDDVLQLRHISVHSIYGVTGLSGTKATRTTWLTKATLAVRVAINDLRDKRESSDSM